MLWQIDFVKVVGRCSCSLAGTPSLRHQY